jgi:hypothetical protein
MKDFRRRELCTRFPALIWNIDTLQFYCEILSPFGFQASHCGK